MANINNKHVTIRVDKTYFERVFEPERRNLGIKIGREFTQREFTAYIARKKLKIKTPKIKDNFSMGRFRL